MSEIVYRGFRQEEMEYQYNPRESVPEYPQLAKRRSEQARKVRESAKSWLGVAYGSSAREAGHLSRRSTGWPGSDLYSRRLLAKRQQRGQLQLCPPIHQTRRIRCSRRV